MDIALVFEFGISKCVFEITVLVGGADLDFVSFRWFL